MIAVLEQDAASEPFGGRPIVVVGSGPVGVRVANELERRGVQAPIVLYGAEPEEPYNRVRLSSLLAGEIPWATWTKDTLLSAQSNVQRRLGCAVVSIDRATKAVEDAAGTVQDYSHLIIATGSTPHIPNIPGTGLPGVYTFSRPPRCATAVRSTRAQSTHGRARGRIAWVGSGTCDATLSYASRRRRTCPPTDAAPAR
jgi:nitrite reductase (NADH) large subunit